jgi:hypothetical protein
MTVYTPKKIGDPISTEIESLCTWLIDGRVTFLLGAGASRGSPTSLPVAKELAGALYIQFKDGFASAALENVDSNDLLAVSDAIANADSNGLTLLQRSLTNMFPFRSARPNHGHRVLACLFAEGLIKVALSTNYDCCIEMASIQIDYPIQVCVEGADMHLGRAFGRLVKVHGCITKEDTILLTTSQLANPPDWASTGIMTGAATGYFVVVGINSPAPYVRKTLENVWQYSQSGSSVWIVSPAISEDWEGLFGEGNSVNKIQSTSEEFFDDILRASIRTQFPQVKRIVAEVGVPEAERQVLETSLEELFGTIKQTEAASFVIFLRSGLVSENHTYPIVTGSLVKPVLIGLALIQAAFGEGVQLNRSGEGMLAQFSNFYIDTALAPDYLSSSKVCERTRERLEILKRQGLLNHPDNPVLILSSGHIGPLPTNTAPPNILAEADPMDIIDGPNTTKDRWIDLNEIIAAPSISVIKQKVLEALR